MMMMMAGLTMMKTVIMIAIDNPISDEKLHCHICSRNFSSRWGFLILVKYYFAYMDFFRHYLQHHIKFVHSNERRYYFCKCDET